MLFADPRRLIACGLQSFHKQVLPMIKYRSFIVFEPVDVNVFSGKDRHGVVY